MPVKTGMTRSTSNRAMLHNNLSRCNADVLCMLKLQPFGRHRIYTGWASVRAVRIYYQTESIMPFDLDINTHQVRQRHQSPSPGFGGRDCGGDDGRRVFSEQSRLNA